MQIKQYYNLSFMTDGIRSVQSQQKLMCYETHMTPACTKLKSRLWFTIYAIDNENTLHIFISNVNIISHMNI